MNAEQHLVIVGGGPGGLAAARSYREAGGQAAVTILTAEGHLPYRRPPLTKEFLRGETSRPELFIQDNGWYTENGISVATGTTVVSLDLERRILGTDNGDVPYDRCVLATGSEPVRLPVPGGDDSGIGVMRTIEDSERVRTEAGPGTRVVVVGSGFIGCEAAASLSLLGADVILLTQESAPQASRLGPEVAGRIRRWLEEYGVDLRFEVEVAGIERSGDGFRVMTRDDEFAAGSVLFGTGVRPRIALAENAGLKIEAGGVATDASMRTSDPNVFAVGDIAAAMNASAGTRQRVEHWGDALNHGTVAGTVLAGGEAVWEMAPGFWSTIGDRSLKYWSWSDGWDEARFVARDTQERESFTVWYGREGQCVGVLAHNADEDYERGRTLVERGEALPA